MLANAAPRSDQSGALGADVHLPATSLYGLLDFITHELPRWRDRADRKRETSETSLTSQLCAHLNSATRRSGGWDFLQFRVEEPDEQSRGRKIDLVPAPCDATGSRTSNPGAARLISFRRPVMPQSGSKAAATLTLTHCCPSNAKDCPLPRTTSGMNASMSPIGMPRPVGFSVSKPVIMELAINSVQ